jgi:ubiquinone biosynthesis protein UbiJ
MTQQTSPRPLPPPPDPFQLATFLVRHARAALDELRQSGRPDKHGLAELQDEIDKLNEDHEALKQRIEQLESKQG